MGQSTFSIVIFTRVRKDRQFPMVKTKIPPRPLMLSRFRHEVNTIQTLYNMVCRLGERSGDRVGASDYPSKYPVFRKYRVFPAHHDKYENGRQIVS